ncbi:NAD-dependent epimerase/dehydratase family protein [Kribbella sp. NPDC004138]
MSTVLVTGASGIAGREVSRVLTAAGHHVRRADIAPSTDPADSAIGEFVRCDTRTPTDVLEAVAGCDAVVHLAAWHNAHQPGVSDATIFAVNVDGTFNVVQACRAAGIRSVVFASSMAYGWGSVYSVTKVLGEDLWKMYREVTGASVALLRYHGFVPEPYLRWGERLLRNGVDVRDIATATAAATEAALAGRIDLFSTIVHSDHAMPKEVQDDFTAHGADWAESRMPGAAALIERHRLALPDRVEQHDLSAASDLLGWRPQHDYIEFLQDLQRREAAGEDVDALWAPGRIPA